MSLDPPIKACASLARKLLSISAEEPSSGGDLPLKPAAKDATTLEESLFRDFLSNADHVTPSTTSTVQLAEDGPLQVYHYTDGTSPCFVVHKIPFKNPADIQQILLHLRQQLVFNELYVSTLRSGKVVARGSREPAVVGVEVCDIELSAFPPSILSAGFPHPRSKNLGSLSIEIAPGGTISASCQFLASEGDNLSAEYVTKVLQTSLSIPLAIRAICRTLLAQKEKKVAEPPKSSSKRKRDE